MLLESSTVERRDLSSFGFDPKWTSEEALLDFRDHRQQEAEPESTPRPSWERELFARAARAKRNTRKPLSSRNAGTASEIRVMMFPRQSPM